MSIQKREPYDIYVTTYGKVRSGTKLTNSDYLYHSFNGAVAFDERERLAVSLASQDVNDRVPMMSKKDFLAKIDSLLG
jgi:hypothetical protein